MSSNPQNFDWHSWFSGTFSFTSTSVSSSSFWLEMSTGSGSTVNGDVFFHDKSVFDELSDAKTFFNYLFLGIIWGYGSLPKKFRWIRWGQAINDFYHILRLMRQVFFEVSSRPLESFGCFFCFKKKRFNHYFISFFLGIFLKIPKKKIWI